MDGKYKVIFFVTEHRGRVSQQDVTTMKLVLDAAPEIGDKYGIIVNMVSKGVLKKLNTEEVYHDFNNSMLAGIDEKNRCVYSNIIFFGRIDELEDEDDILVPPDTFKDAKGVTLAKFVKQIVPVILIKKETVSDVNTEIFDKVNKRLKEKREEIQRKDDAWKEERRQFELRRIEEAEKYNQKIDALEKKIIGVNDRERRKIKSQESRKATDEITHIMNNLEVGKLFYLEEQNFLQIIQYFTVRIKPLIATH